MKHQWNKFKQWRIAAQVSQKELSGSLGYSSGQFVSNWERSTSTPPFKSVKKLASIFGVPAKEIADEIERIKKLNLEQQIKHDRKYLGI